LTCDGSINSPVSATSIATSGPFVIGIRTVTGIAIGTASNVGVASRGGRLSLGAVAFSVGRAS